ncbi:MAG: pantoate--beta-alanine ligase [Candidatus Sumerlaeaceae bacterium]|nr:pantoate--beta-alanine ligase [Candidatus Sumerlaeaceae bacterium]
MDLETIESVETLRQTISCKRSEGLRVSFVPTMGFLHEGHAALIRKAAEMAPVVVVSVFVNPLQFGPSEDFDRYPRDIEHDKKVILAAGGNVLFAPSADVLTPINLEVMVDPGSLASVLCGRSRPGHFRGVCTIVAKLFNIVQPDYAVFGWKDAQQLIIIKKMVSDLNFPIEIVGVETVREADGLAMSSRNVYLSAEERRRAPVLYQALEQARHRAIIGDCTDAHLLRKSIISRIVNEMGGRVDYVEVVRISDLVPLNDVEIGNTMIAAAVFLGQTRLIDNVRF